MLTLGIIPKSFPVKLVLKIVIIVVLGAATAIVLLYYSNNIRIEGSYVDGLRTISNARHFIVRKSVVIYLSTSVFILVGVVVLALLYSHRVAGPLYRLKMAAKQISEGDFSVDIKLRRTDAIHPLAEAMNYLVQMQRQRIFSINRGLDAMKDALENLDKAIEGRSDDDKTQAIEGLSIAASELNRCVQDIRLCESR